MIKIDDRVMDSKLFIKSGVELLLSWIILELGNEIWKGEGLLFISTLSIYDYLWKQPPILFFATLKIHPDF